MTEQSMAFNETSFNSNTNKARSPSIIAAAGLAKAFKGIYLTFR